MESIAIDEYKLRPCAQLIQGAVHGQQGRFQDIDLVDLFGAYLRHGPGQAFFFNDLPQGIALFFGNLFGVIQPGMVKIRRQNHRCSKHRTRQAAPTSFVATSLQKFCLMKG